MKRKTVAVCAGILGMLLVWGYGAGEKAEVMQEPAAVSREESEVPLEPETAECSTQIEEEMEAEKENMAVKDMKPKIRYSPDGYNMWDAWYTEKDGQVHLIHLKGLAGGVDYDEAKENVRGYGHAVSEDLVLWTEQEDILKIEDSHNPLDQEFRYTGCTIENEGTYYTYYTMRKGQGQRIGVAVSKDLYEWEEYEGNPVLIPDEEWFITFANENVSNHRDWGGIVDCRDMLVIKDEAGDGFWGYFVASADTGMTSPTSVVGVAWSEDLFHWEQKGIAYAPKSVAMPEMVDVFRIEDKWYMTLTTAKNNGCISGFSDPYITRAQIYAVADSPQGPFVENPEDNVMMGGQLSSGCSSRSIVFKGKRRVLYTDNNNGESVVSLPKDIYVNEEGHLRLHYAADLLENIRTGRLKDSIAVQPNTSFAWNTSGGTWKKNGDEFTCSTDQNSWQPFLMKGIANNMELEFVMDAQSDCSMLGIVLSNRGDGSALNDLNHILVMDLENDRVYLTDALWDLANCRQYLFEKKTEYHFRMLLIGNTIELYINDEMVFNSGIDNTGAYRAGLFVNDGKILVRNLALYGLKE